MLVSPLLHDIDERLLVRGGIRLLPPWIPNRVSWCLCCFADFPGAAGRQEPSGRSSSDCRLERGELPQTVEKSLVGFEPPPLLPRGQGFDMGNT